MGKTKTFTDIDNQVFSNSLETCHYVSGIAQPKSKILVRCIHHDLSFEVSYDAIRKSTHKHLICPKCIQENHAKTKVTICCDFCGKQFVKRRSKLVEFNFCSRSCKTNAQRLDSGDKFTSLRPDHYKNGKSAYRVKALAAYDNVCEICGWCEDPDVLEVHHIDENRANNNLDNLIILCPTCHKN